jgi:hypothetical protein
MDRQPARKGRKKKPWYGQPAKKGRKKADSATENAEAGFAGGLKRETVRLSGPISPTN